jgi:HPt (histidine-containing phosphotransfer) domain-containing protein
MERGPEKGRDELEAALHQWLGGRARPQDEPGATGGALGAASDPARMRERLRELEILDLPEVLREVVEAFASDSNAKVASLLEALQAGDFGRCEMLAHGLNGAAANMGAMQIADLARQFEAAAHAADGDRCRPLFDALSHAHASLATFLTSLLSAAPEGSRVE